MARVVVCAATMAVTMLEFNVKPTPETAMPVNRALFGVRDIASFDRPPIEALSAATGADINGANFVYQKAQSKQQGGEGKASENPRRVFAAAGNSFPAMFEISGMSGEYAAASFEGAKRNPPFAAKAAQVYETNTEVINGSRHSLGTSVSLIL